MFEVPLQTSYFKHLNASESRRYNFYFCGPAASRPFLTATSDDIITLSYHGTLIKLSRKSKSMNQDL